MPSAVNRHRAAAILASALSFALGVQCLAPRAHAIDTTSTPSSSPALLDDLKPFAVVSGERVPAPDIEMGDLATIKRIINEGKNRSQVIGHVKYLSEAIGARLTTSSNLQRANDWAVEQFKGWGLSNVRNEEWGTAAVRFDRGPSTAKVLYRNETSDTDAEGKKTTKVTYTPARDLQFTTLAWVRGTEGPVRGKVLKKPLTNAEFEKVKDQIPGSWLLITAKADGRRGTRGINALMRERHSRWAELREKADNPAPEAAPAAPESAAAAAPNPAAPAAESYPSDGVSGRYAGNIKGPGLPEAGVEADFILRRFDDGSFSGSVSIPGYHAGPIAAATFDDPSRTLRFTWAHPAGESKYELIARDGVMSGTAVSQTGSFTVRFSPNQPGVTATADGPKSAADALAETRAIEAKILALNPAGFLSSSRDERVWTTSSNGWRTLDLAKLPRDVEVNMRESDYDFINSRLYDGVELAAEINLDHRLIPGPIPLYNTIAEIPGTEKPDEVVIMSAHLDSWDGPGSQGTLDNGTGSSVMMEAARILMTANAKPKRTIRFILWTGEEQGLLGARAYVQAQKDNWNKIVACFVDDGGTDFQGGIPAADDMLPMLKAATQWTNAAFASDADQMGGTGKLVNLRPTGPRYRSGGGSDHAAFNEVGIPGFFWDEIGRSDYQFGWHTQNDRFNLAIPEYLIQSATNSALVAYQLACAPDMLPRGEKEPPKEPETQTTPTQGTAR
jgi:hypothetical protein